MSSSNPDLASAPTLTRVGTVPATPRKLFLNLPVEDLPRSIRFFEALGFTFNAQFTDATAAAMLVGEDAYVMLLTHERFQGYSQRPLGRPHAETSALLALSADSRDEVTTLVETALAHGATPAADPVDHGFMVGWSFFDPDGHHWEVFWMDPAAIQN